MTSVEFKILKDLSKLKNPSIVVGFPGTGLVGSVAAAHLIDALKLDFGGYISSDEFAPLAAIHDYTPMPPARVHYSEKYNLILILSEMSVPVSLASPLADSIFDFAKSLNSKKIISVGGISLKEGKNEVYVIATQKEITKEITDRKIAKPIREGATTGVTGLLLSKGAMNEFPVITLLAESAEEYLDADAASRVLKALSKLLDIEINTARLDREAKGTKEALIKSKISKRGPTVEEGAGGSMYG